MKFPDIIKINIIDEISVCHFELDETIGKHYYVVIPVDKNKDLIISIITSKINNRIERYKKKEPEAVKSLLKVNKTDIKCLTKDSVIECNQAEIYSKKELSIKINPIVGFNILEILNEDLQFKIIENILISPIVDDELKETLKEYKDKFEVGILDYFFE